ncbi:MAG: DNA repair exonuclease [Myxococcota bacterium]
MSRSKPDEPEELKLLAIGDVHLGLRPASLPDGLEEEGVDPRALTPEAALRRAIDWAIEAGVDAVVFAGDVVESTNARFEALRPLEAAVRRLREADIAVLAVAGNHDVEALPRLARMLEGFELLGEGGRWQSRVVESVGGVAVELLGWSFPEKQVFNSPVDQWLRNPIPPIRTGLPRVGLLHGDLDASGGPYAPITTRELNESGLDAWLLGHIHQPSLPEGRQAAGDSPFGYLGSLVGLDPGELGLRGPWLVSVNQRGEIATKHLALAPLRWERLELRVDEADGPEEVGDRLLVEIVRFAEEIQAGGDSPTALGVRPILTGMTRHYEELRRAMSDGRWNGVMRSAGSTVVFIDKVLDRLHLAYDLEELSRGDDPAALMAQKLRLLQEPSDVRNVLLEAAREALKERAEQSRWSSLDQIRDATTPLGDDSALAALLTRAGTETLHALLEQRKAPAGGQS